MALFTYPLHEHPFVQFNCTGDFSVKTGVCLFSSCVVKLSHKGHRHCVNGHFSSYIKEEFVPLQFKGFSCFYVKTGVALKAVGSQMFFFTEGRSKEMYTITSKAPWPVVCSE